MVLPLYYGTSYAASLPDLPDILKAFENSFVRKSTGVCKLEPLVSSSRTVVKRICP